LAAGIAGLAGVGGFGALVKGSFESIDALAKLSYDTGIATEELAGLVHVAELSDVSSQSLGKSLQRMQRSISDASNGMATAQRSFNQLGLSIETLRSLSPEEQFIAIGEAIERVPNQADRTRFAMELMGRS